MLFDDTVANNIALWQEGVDRERVVAAARRAHCAEFIEALPAQYEAQVGDRGALLSGGQRQRLAIARELLKQPEILVLDEATSALDSESESAIQRSIDELKGQMTIVIIAHRLSTIRGVDRIYVLHEGRIVESGTYDELWRAEGSRFRRMCELQQLGDDQAETSA
jgi:subfamily B ATP-binding cassette protein MsbA